MATDWTVRGSNSGGGEIFRTCPDRPWGLPNLLCNGYRVFPGGKERSEGDADPSPPSSAVVIERVELYLYSPYEPYGLYRASVLVQGCTLPLFKSPGPILHKMLIHQGAEYLSHTVSRFRNRKAEELRFDFCQGQGIILYSKVLRPFLGPT